MYHNDFRWTEDVNQRKGTYYLIIHNMIIIINDGDDDNIQVYHIIIRWGICNEKATISLPVLLGAKISKLSGRA